MKRLQNTVKGAISLYYPKGPVKGYLTPSSPIFVYKKCFSKIMRRKKNPSGPSGYIPDTIWSISNAYFWSERSREGRP